MINPVRNNVQKILLDKTKTPKKKKKKNCNLCKYSSLDNNHVYQNFAQIVRSLTFHFKTCIIVVLGQGVLPTNCI